MTLIGIAGEDKNHFAVVTRLVDDALVADHAWLHDVVESCRTWCGIHSGESWYKCRPDDGYDLRPLNIGGRRIALQGRIGGERLRPEANMWRRVLLLFCQLDPRPEIVILARDLDGYLERRGGIEQVRDHLPWPFPIVVATPEPEIESWIVSGFVPRDPTEQMRLDAVRKELFFDPTTQSYRLTSHPNDARTDAKLILSRLCGDAVEREGACLDDREVLHERGELNGARAFLDDVDVRLVPLFGRAAR